MVHNLTRHMYMFISRGYPIHLNVNWKKIDYKHLLFAEFSAKSCGDLIYNIWEWHPVILTHDFIALREYRCVLCDASDRMYCWMGLCESFVETKSIAIQDSFLASDLWMKMTHQCLMKQNIA